MPVQGKTYREVMKRIEQEPHQVDLLVIDRETDEAFASRREKPSGQADGVLRRWTPARPPRPTIGTASQQATRGRLERTAAPGPNVAEREITASSERHHYVAEDGTLIEYREPSFLRRSDHVPVFTAPRTARPHMHSGSSSLTSMSMTSSGAITPLDPGEGLRLCHLVKWSNFDGYGFAMTPDRRRTGHFIAHVDIGGPAHLGGLRKRDRIVEVNGYDVEGQSYRDVVNRIKEDPTRVELLVIDRETDEEFARRRQRPSSLADSVVQRWTPTERPLSVPGAAKTQVCTGHSIMSAVACYRLTITSGCAHGQGQHSLYFWLLQGAPKSPVSSALPSLAVTGNTSCVFSSVPNNQQAKPAASSKPAACSYNTDSQKQRIESQGTPSKTVPSEPLPVQEGALSLQNVPKDCGISRDNVDTLPAIKYEPRYRAQQSAKPDTVAPSERSPHAPPSKVATESPFVSPELNDSGWFPLSLTKNAADYFSIADEQSGNPSAPFTPTHSGTPSPFGSPSRSPASATPSAAGPSDSSAQRGRRHSSPWCPAAPVALQAPYVPIVSVSYKDQPTTYAPGYSDFFTMYSGYASRAPLSSATEAPSSQVQQQGCTNTSRQASSETTDAS
ncbi:uncharacterized protein LOC144119517 [Amblyomma americanum]